MDCDSDFCSLCAGENVHEAIADPDWECPACREICNCSGVSLRETLVQHVGQMPTSQAGVYLRFTACPQLFPFLLIHLASTNPCAANNCVRGSHGWLPTRELNSEAKRLGYASVRHAACCCPAFSPQP